MANYEISCVQRKKYLGRIQELGGGGGWGGGVVFGNVHLHYLIVIVVKQVIFHKEKYGQNDCVCFTTGGSTEPPEPPLDRPLEHDLLNFAALVCKTFIATNKDLLSSIFRSYFICH